MKNLITKAIVDKLLDNYPQINGDYCLNKKQKRYECTVCKDICKQNSIISAKDNNIDTSTCDDCSLCVANCPTGAITGSLNFMEKAFSVLNNDYGEIILSCSKSTSYSDCTMDCLASYPWELICILAINNKIYFSKDDCTSCDINCDYTYMLNKVQSFLGEERFNNSIFFEEKDLQFSRKDIFNLAFKKSKNTMLGLIRNVSTIEEFDQIFRKILVHKLNDMAVNWETPLFNDNCRACNICTTLCPTNALTLFNDESDTYYMAHFSKKCRGCAHCETVCPYDGINEITTKKSNNSKAFITQLDVVHCKECNSLTTNENKICDRCNNNKFI